MVRKPRRRQLPEEEFQMAPMIDMVFLLLVFFMCISTLAQADKNVPLNLPESSESKIPEDLAGRGVISLDDNGVIFVNARPLTVEELKKQIGQALSADPELQILVRADRKTTFAHIRKVLNTCAEVGAFEIIYATYEASSG